MSSLTLLLSPLLPVWLPLLAAPFVYLLRRHAAVAALLSSSVTAAAGWWILTRPPAEGAALLGRTLQLGGLGQVMLVALALWLIGAFLIAARLSPGWSLFPLLLVDFGLISAALIFSELVLQVLLLKLAWLIMTMLVQGRSGGQNRAATRLLILTVLALPPFLIAAWLIEQRLFDPGSAALTAAIVLTLGMGFALSLAIIPFHAWLPQTAEDASPLVAAWLAAGMGGGYLVVLINLLATYGWLAENPQVQRLLFNSGLLMAIGGALLLVTERHLGRLWAYAVLVDLGYVLLGLSFGSRDGMVGALLTLFGRIIALLLSGGALSLIRHHAGSLDFDDLLGVGHRLPLSMLTLAIGSLALLGVPLTPGFPGHLLVLHALSARSTGWLVALVAAALLGFVGFLRAFAVMTSRDEERDLDQIPQEPRAPTALLLGLSAGALLFSLAPRSVDPVVNFLLRALGS